MPLRTSDRPHGSGESDTHFSIVDSSNAAVEATWRTPSASCAPETTTRPLTPPMAMARVSAAEM